MKYLKQFIYSLVFLSSSLNYGMYAAALEGPKAAIINPEYMQPLGIAGILNGSLQISPTFKVPAGTNGQKLYEEACAIMSDQLIKDPDKNMFDNHIAKILEHCNKKKI